jgi:hypothetical protein
MMNQGQYYFHKSNIRAAFLLMAVSAIMVDISGAQIKPSMKIRLNVLPSINIARMDVDLKTLFAEDISHMNELASVNSVGEAPISLDFGFSISAYENIEVLIHFTKPDSSDNNGLFPMRMICGYINDGTAFFKRAIFANKDIMQFRLRNNNLLKSSMKLSDPLLVAYTFFLVSLKANPTRDEGHIPVSVITLEYL